MRFYALSSRSLIKSAGILTFFLFLLISILTFSTQPASAQETSPTPSSIFNTNPDVPKNAHTGIQVIILETMSAVACQLTGYDPISQENRCLGVDPKTGQIGFVDNGGGMIAVMGSMIDMTFTPPASSTQYARYLNNNFGIVKDTYAQNIPNNVRASTCGPNGGKVQGLGFCGLEPILGLWIVMRNIVYMIFVLVFVVIGLGIMLRIHIDPRTVMTIQNQIPKIIIALLAVTFSFAIAGVLIDVMYITIYLFAQVIGGAGNVDPNIISNTAAASNPFFGINSAFQGGAWEHDGVIGIAGQTSGAFSEMVKSIFDNQSSNFGGDVVGDFLSGLVGTVVNILGFLIIAIAIVSALVRLWVTLIIAYVNIILDIVFSPFWILTGLLPGGSMGLGAWLRDMLGNIALFPMTISFMLLGNIFINSFDGDSATRFVPPLIGGTNQDSIGAIIGLGFLLMLPGLLQITKAAFKAPKIDFGPVFKPIAAGAGVVTKTPKRLINVGERTRYATGSDKFSTFFKIFGNPLYRSSGKGGHG